MHRFLYFFPLWLYGTRYLLMEYTEKSVRMQSARVGLAAALYFSLTSGSVSEWWFYTCLECITMVVNGTGCIDMWSAWVEPLWFTDTVWTVAYAPPVTIGRTQEPHPANHHCDTIQSRIETTILIHNLISYSCWCLQPAGRRTAYTFSIKLGCWRRVLLSGAKQWINVSCSRILLFRGERTASCWAAIRSVKCTQNRNAVRATKTATLGAHLWLHCI